MELVTIGQQTIQPGEDILFQAVSVPGSASIIWRAGSGIVTLRGLHNNQCRARFSLRFGANIAAPTEATAAEPLTLAFAVNGEAITSSRIISTPEEENLFNNISREIYLDVPTGCCTQVAVKNIGTIPILLQDGNWIIERRA